MIRLEAELRRNISIACEKPTPRFLDLYRIFGMQNFRWNFYAPQVVICYKVAYRKFRSFVWTNSEKVSKLWYRIRPSTIESTSGSQITVKKTYIWILQVSTCTGYLDRLESMMVGFPHLSIKSRDSFDNGCWALCHELCENRPKLRDFPRYRIRWECRVRRSTRMLEHRRRSRRSYA